jgi:hypothetical protein
MGHVCAKVFLRDGGCVRAKQGRRMAPDPGLEYIECDYMPFFNSMNLQDVNSETRIGAENMRRILA